MLGVFAQLGRVFAKVVSDKLIVKYNIDQHTTRQNIDWSWQCSEPSSGLWPTGLIPPKWSQGFSPMILNQRQIFTTSCRPSNVCSSDSLLGDNYPRVCQGMQKKNKKLCINLYNYIYIYIELYIHWFIYLSIYVIYIWSYLPASQSYSVFAKIHRWNPSHPLDAYLDRYRLGDIDLGQRECIVGHRLCHLPFLGGAQIIPKSQWIETCWNMLKRIQKDSKGPFLSPKKSCIRLGIMCACSYGSMKYIQNRVGDLP